MKERLYVFCPSCNSEVLNCDSKYLRNIHNVMCGKCNTFSHIHQVRLETKQTDEFTITLSPYEALSELQKGTKLEYFDGEDYWFPLCKNNPIRLLWECKIRVK